MNNTVRNPQDKKISKHGCCKKDHVKLFFLALISLLFCSSSTDIKTLHGPPRCFHFILAD